ncbi:PilZ domain-containing protein [Sphingomonas laterariae]|uniref:PilZ domain-containing protein n=1 Tax=Edaphosphingomonas laterariae TaxID=861865 RepID=A0A239G596_9SPHN|nr:PilZ domain-containing protein [Sphingomonas laterariae]SNS63822.1 PilZ domain-containing protein [Sphingomonas laterariae]
MAIEGAKLTHDPLTHFKYGRRHGRHRVQLLACLHSPRGTLSAVLLDISQGGALVSCPTPIEEGTHVTLTRGSLNAEATVVRTEGRRLGLSFADPIDAELVANVVTPLALWAN